MKTFITEDFMLQNDAARELYHNYAKDQPIIDFHCHLPPAEIAANHHFENLYQIWLAGDHYKWRAMRTNGIAERYCTGDAPDQEKFLAFARTVPMAMRNPLYHWTHLELLRYFDIDDLLNEESAASIWQEANTKLPNLPVHALLEQSKVEAVCTTDDPTDSLEHHKAIAADGKLHTRVYPTFRPDKGLAIEQTDAFNAWVDKLEQVSGVKCDDFAGFLSALKQRHDAFHEIGGRLSDHGVSALETVIGTEDDATSAFADARKRESIRPDQAAKYRSFLMVYFGRLNAEKGWTMQLHLGPMRNNNARKFRELGPDTGFDSIGDWRQGPGLQLLMDQLDATDELPKMILYNVNPNDNYLFATMAGNFQDGSIPGKIQFGSGWWFLDQKEGMQWQLNALSNLGLLSRFVGMLTDSRSFLSYPRHEYFRRILCNLIGQDIENGELPRDMPFLGEMVANICYGNARNFFGLSLPE